MEKLKLSNYARIVERIADHAVYHSLFGNLCIVGAEALAFLKSFQTPKTYGEALHSSGIYDEGHAKNLIESFKSKYLLIPEHFDEYSIVENDMKQRKNRASYGYLVRALQLVVSNACNFKCKYCFVNNMYNSPERLADQSNIANRYMSREIAGQAMEKLTALLKANGHKYLNVEFFGGEPLTNWNTVKYVLEQFGNSHNGVEILYSITTNGSLITEEISSLFKKYRVSVVLSFDSPNNTERVSADNKNAIQLLLPKLDILNKDNNWVAFNSLISKDTVSDYDSRGLVDLAKQNGISAIGLILDLNLDSYEDKQSIPLIVDRLWETYTYAVRKGITVSGYWYQIYRQIIGKQAALFQSGYKACPATGCKLSVEPDGNIYACKCCSGQIGDIYRLEQALSSQKYMDYAMRAYKNSDECAGCEIEGFCSGACMGSLERKYGGLYGKEKAVCYIYKEITRRLIIADETVRCYL